MSEYIGVALLGAGNVGGGVIRALQQGEQRYAAAVGRPLELRGALVRDSSRPRHDLNIERLTTDVDVLLSDSKVHIVVELMGGEEPALQYISRALTAGKHVVTANKEAIFAGCRWLNEPSDVGPIVIDTIFGVFEAG